MQPGQHHAGYIALLIFTWIMLILMFFFNALATTDATYLKWGIFQGTTGQVSDEFYLEITPAGWTFGIWGFIYAYQVIWMIYVTVIVFRKAADGTPLYTIRPYLHWANFCVYIVNTICNIAWLILWDRKLLIAALVFLVLTALTLYINVVLSVSGIYKYYRILWEKGFMYEHRLVLGLVTNAFAMYGTWVTIATLLNLGMVLTYWAGLSQSISSTIALSILTFELIVFLLLDLALFERFTRFIFTTYIVLIVALSGIVSKNYDGNNPNSIFTLMLLVAACIMFCVKIAVAIYGEMKRPAFIK